MGIERRFSGISKYLKVIFKEKNLPKSSFSIEGIGKLKDLIKKIKAWRFVG
jgi:hypothetical protein